MGRRLPGSRSSRGAAAKKAGGAAAIRAGQPAIGGSERKTPVPLDEHVFLARQDLSQAQVDALAQAATQIVESNQGRVAKTETWGLRSLAYKIHKNRKAHFVMLNIDAPAGVVAELERQTAINEDVIRFLTVRVDAHESGPSAMMRKNERDRGGRRREREGE
jgi:small subunit ribosomal protein S6